MEDYTDTALAVCEFVLDNIGDTSDMQMARTDLRYHIAYIAARDVRTGLPSE